MLKKKIFLFAVIVFLVFGLLTYQGIKGEGRFFDSPLYPLRLLEKGASKLVTGVENIVFRYIIIVGKEDENRLLQQRIDELIADKNKSTETLLENQRLRNLLKLKNEIPSYIASAEVFARDPTNWFQILWINKGEVDGVARDMVAVTPKGPIGRIYKVFDEESNIILITDINSSVAVRLQDSRVEGILEGRGDNRCYLKYIAREDDVDVGNALVTSGLDGIYPKGLLIGHVSAVEKNDDEIFQRIEVMPSQNLKKVEEVAILKR